MQNIKEILLSFKKEDFEKDVNLHIHTTFSDGKSTPEEILEQAKKLNMKKIAICDHNTIKAYEDKDILNSELIIPAIEFDCWFMGCLIHILGYGIDIKNKELLYFCAKSQAGTRADIVRLFSFRNTQKVIKAIHNAGGIAILAHPACCWNPSLNFLVKKLIKIGIDGLEVYYTYKRHRSILKFHSEKKVERIANKYNLIKTGGTDEHGSLKK